MVAAMRGMPVPAPPNYEFVSRGKSTTGATLVSAPSDKAEVQREWDAAHRALQLLPSLQSSRAAAARQRDVQTDKAFYSFQTKTVNLTERSEVLPRDPRAEMGTLAHELVHYMQDLELDIESLHASAPADPDAQSSVRALIEGEASYIGWSVQSRVSGAMPDPSDWSAYFDQLDDAYLAKINGSTTPLETARDALPYSVGGRAVVELWDHSGRAAIDALYENIPDTFSAWLQRNAAAETERVELGCVTPSSPVGYELRDQTHMGALGALAFLAVNNAADLDVVAPIVTDTLFLYVPLRAAPAATDSQNTYANNELPVVAVWLLRFASEAEAQTFELAMPVVSSQDRTYTRKKTVVALAVSTDPAQRAAATLQALDCQ